MRHLLNRSAHVLLASLGLLISGTVFAQAFDAVRLYSAAPDTSGGQAGVAVLAGQEYRGSDERRTRVLPLLDYQWRSGWFAGTTNGIGYNFSGNRSFDYGLRVTADLGREEKRSSRLRGLGDIDPAPEIGAFFNYRVLPSVALTSSLRYGAGNDNDGLVLDLGAVYSRPLGQRWRIGAGVAGTWVNSAYMQDYFGITTAQAASSGYAPYNAQSGLRDLRANAAVTYAFTPRVTLTTAISLSSLQGDAADSPLTRKKTSASGVAALAYAF